jgi:hypothetical protein
MMIYGYIPKSKKRKVTKAKKVQHEEWLLSINSLSTNFSKTKSTKISNNFPSYNTPAGRETPHFASIDTGFIALTKPVPNSHSTQLLQSDNDDCSPAFVSGPDDATMEQVEVEFYKILFHY